jgi:deoxyhypusine synthase
LTKAIETLLTDNSLRHNLVEKAYNVAMENHNIAVMEKKLQNILH